MAALTVIQILSAVFTNTLQRILDQDSQHFLDYIMTNRFFLSYNVNKFTE